MRFLKKNKTIQFVKKYPVESAIYFGTGLALSEWLTRRQPYDISPILLSGSVVASEILPPSVNLCLFAAGAWGGVSLITKTTPAYVVANGYPGQVYVKPEEDMRFVPWRKSFANTYPIDGLYLPELSDKVFKVPNGLRVKIEPNGQIKVTGIIPKGIAKVRGGWITRPAEWLLPK